jgi:hypothetical protein
MAQKKKTETEPKAEAELKAEDYVGAPKPGQLPADGSVEPQGLGAEVSKDGNFTVTLKDNGVVGISPRPWEGPDAMTTRVERLDELIEALKKLK